MLSLFFGIALLYLFYALFIKKSHHKNDDGNSKLLFNNRADMIWLGAIFIISRLILKWQYPDSAILRVELDTLSMIFSILFLVFIVRAPFYGLKIIVPVGGMANLLAKATNGFCMPVNKTLAKLQGITDLTPTHCWADADTNLVFLTDQISSNLVTFSVASIGDVLLWLGTIITAIQVFFVLRNNRKKPAY